MQPFQLPLAGQFDAKSLKPNEIVEQTKFIHLPGRCVEDFIAKYLVGYLCLQKLVLKTICNSLWRFVYSSSFCGKNNWPLCSLTLFCDFFSFLSKMCSCAAVELQWPCCDPGCSGDEYTGADPNYPVSYTEEILTNPNYGLSPALAHHCSCNKELERDCAVLWPAKLEGGIGCCAHLCQARRVYSPLW